MIKVMVSNLATIKHKTSIDENENEEEPCKFFLFI